MACKKVVSGYACHLHDVGTQIWLPYVIPLAELLSSGQAGISAGYILCHIISLSCTVIQAHSLLVCRERLVFGLWCLHKRGHKLLIDQQGTYIYIWQSLNRQVSLNVHSIIAPIHSFTGLDGMLNVGEFCWNASTWYFPSHPMLAPVANYMNPASCFLVYLGVNVAPAFVKVSVSQFPGGLRRWETAHKPPGAPVFLYFLQHLPNHRTAFHFAAGPS